MMIRPTCCTSHPSLLLFYRSIIQTTAIRRSIFIRCCYHSTPAIFEGIDRTTTTKRRNDGCCNFWMMTTTRSPVRTRIVQRRKYTSSSLSSVFRNEASYNIQPSTIVPIYIGGIPTLPSVTVDNNNNDTSHILLPVYDKYSGEQFCSVPVTDAMMMEKATRIASTIGKDKMRQLLPYERQEILYNVAKHVQDRYEEIAYYITIEVGKAITDSRKEVDRCIQTFLLAGEEATRINHGSYVDYQHSSRTKGYSSIIRRFPLNGPIACIAPFNFPLNLVAHKIAPAIAVGCSFVLKPSERTPLSSIIIGEILHNDPIMPNEGFSIVPCRRADSSVGDQLVTDERFKLISFTGSAQVGFHHIKGRSGKKPVVLELGGNAYCIVNDIDHIPFDTMITDIVNGAFFQSGQSCISIQHLLVHDTIYDAVKKALVERVLKLKVGNPHEDDTFIGPLIDNASVVRIESWVKDAVQRQQNGATILCGTGQRWVEDNRCSNFIAPTIIENVPHDCMLSYEEVFGPILCMERYHHFDDAIHRVNASKYGLQVGIYTNQNHLIQQAYETIDCGSVCINIPPSTRIDAQPYGGNKDSGIGREGIRYIMEHHYTDCKVLLMKQ